MSSPRLNNVFRLQKTNRVARHWKQPPKKSFHRVSRDKILQDSWSISAALARGFSDRHFERAEGPGDEVGTKTNNKLNARMSPSPGIGPGPQWWKASVLTTAPSLLHLRSHIMLCTKLILSSKPLLITQKFSPPLCSSECMDILWFSIFPYICSDFKRF